MRTGNGRGEDLSGGGLQLWLLQPDFPPPATGRLKLRRRLALWVSWLIAGAAPREIDASGGTESRDKETHF